MTIGHVFVYGTLKKGQVNHRLIARSYKRYCSASIQGILYDLPFGYPAVVLGKGTVHGELYEFEDITAVLSDLDELEGYVGEEGPNEYDRILCKAQLKNGNLVDCYTYVQTMEQIKQLGKRAVLVKSGRWE